MAGIAEKQRGRPASARPRPQRCARARPRPASGQRPTFRSPASPAPRRSSPRRPSIWSDLHLADRSILLVWSRPFWSIEEMNRHLLTRWSERVGAGDTIICLGDVGHPDAWRHRRLVVDVRDCPRPAAAHPRQPRCRPHRGAAAGRLRRAGARRRCSRPSRHWR